MQRTMNFMNVDKIEIGNAVAHNHKKCTPHSEREIVIHQAGETTRIVLFSNGTKGALDLLAK